MEQPPEVRRMALFLVQPHRKPPTNLEYRLTKGGEHMPLCRQCNSVKAHEKNITLPPGSHVSTGCWDPSRYEDCSKLNGKSCVLPILRNIFLKNF
eukprot:jgi/Botrbrau1/4632/Bobra.33_2s0004.1